MKTIKYNIIALCICCIGFSSCLEDITLPIGSGTRMLQVEGGITTDTMAHQIKLNITNDLYAIDPPEPVTGALVTITEGTNVHPLTESTPGIYETAADFFAIPNKTYRLDIKEALINGEMGDYWAESSIYTLDPIDSISIKKFNRDEGYYQINIHLTDNGDIENYYLGKLSINNKSVTDTLNDWFVIDDALFNGNRIPGQFPLFVIPVKGFESDDYYEPTIENGDVITVHAYGITKGYFNFISAASSSGAGSNPMLGSPASPPSNIYPAGRACGYFSVMSARHASAIFRE